MNPTPDNLENRVAAFHGSVFFREFSFSRNQFKPNPRDELEFADQVVHCGENFLVYQLKERETSAIKDDKSEENWFNKRVLKGASSQIRDTLRYLEEHSSIELMNQQGHVVDVITIEKNKIHKLIIYRTPRPDLLVAKVRHKISKTAGFIHIFTAVEYEKICECLYTPAEIAEYLAFREGVLTKDGSISEDAILGQFVSESTKEEPSESFSQALSTFINDVERINIRDIVNIFQARIVNDGGHPQRYYKILTQFSRLTRASLRCFVERFNLCVTNAKEQKDPFGPTLFYTQDCGFVFTVPPRELTQNERVESLSNITDAAKHHGKMDTQVGVSFAWDLPMNDWLIDWCYIEHPCEPSNEPELERIARTMFPPLREAVLPRYLHYKEAEAIRPKPSFHCKIGRNEFCLCGSGKKFKKCCGASA